MDYLGNLTRQDVADAASFSRYAHQRLGMPEPPKSAVNKITSEVRKLQQEHPYLTYQGLCGIVEWANVRRIRYANPFLLFMAYRYAWRDGYLPELDQHREKDETIESEITRALDVEGDPVWRQKLIASEGPEARRKVWIAWATETQQSSCLFPELL